MKNWIVFFEIPASDFRRAVDFYETVLDIKLSVFECEYEKMACFTEKGETVGAISYATGFIPSENGVLIHFEIKDMDKSLDKVIRKGGRIVIPKTKIEVENKGYFALFTDSEGNRVGFYSAN